MYSCICQWRSTAATTRTWKKLKSETLEMKYDYMKHQSMIKIRCDWYLLLLFYSCIILANSSNVINPSPSVSVAENMSWIASESSRLTVFCRICDNSSEMQRNRRKLHEHWIMSVGHERQLFLHWFFRSLPHPWIFSKEKLTGIWVPWQPLIEISPEFGAVQHHPFFLLYLLFFFLPLPVLLSNVSFFCPVDVLICL